MAEVIPRQRNRLLVSLGLFFLRLRRSVGGMAGLPGTPGRHITGLADAAHAVVLGAGRLPRAAAHPPHPHRDLLARLLHRARPDGRRPAGRPGESCAAGEWVAGPRGFWTCPPGWLLPGGFGVDWLAAGTYDRSVGLSLFTGQITHKIDQDVDVERDHIIASITTTTTAAQVEVLRNYSSGYHSRNGGGDGIETDGDLPVVDLSGLGGSAPLEVESQPEAEGAHRPPQVVSVPRSQPCSDWSTWASWACSCCLVHRRSTWRHPSAASRSSLRWCLLRSAL